MKLRFLVCGFAVGFVGAGLPAFAQEPQNGSFTFVGATVSEFHCAPKEPGKHPAVIMLHGGLEVQSYGTKFWRDACEDFARRGYYASFIEYYSFSGMVSPGPSGSTWQNLKARFWFPWWVHVVSRAIEHVHTAPEVGDSPVALLGFSLGSAIALSEAAADSARVRAVVDIGGDLPFPYSRWASDLPPVLIVHGGADEMMPVDAAHKLDTLLVQDGRKHLACIYSGAGHEFMIPQSASYKPADATDAWDKIFRFLHEQLKQGR